MPRPTDELDDFDDDVRGPGPVEPHRGVVVLVMGVLSLMFSCFVFGLIAIFMGRCDLSLMRQGLMDKEGEPLTRVGYILGIVGTVLSALVVLLLVAYFALIAVLIARK